MTDDLVQRLFTEADNFKADREVGMRAMLYRAADRIEQLEREKAVVSDLWEQQKEIALDYLTDCNKAADRIEAQAAEIEQWKVDYNELLLEAAKLRAALKNHSYTGEGWRPFKEIYEALREKNDER